MNIPQPTSPLSITKAMLFAAGFGKRMHPLTHTTPKPLIKVAGKTLLDHNLDHLAANGIQDVVVNTHYLADQVHNHVAKRLAAKQPPHIIISHEKEEILETAGGIIYALPHIGKTPFFSINGDIIWLDATQPHIPNTLEAMDNFYDENTMDILMLLHPKETAIGYDGTGDFHLSNDGYIERPKPGTPADYVFTGMQILHPRIFKGLTCKPFSMREIYFNHPNIRIRAIVNEGKWLHIGTKEGVKEAEKVLI